MNVPSNPVLLLVDDFDDAQEIYQTYLQLYGYTVACASDGHEALRLAREISPSLILLDLRMPGLSGTDTLRQLRADPGVPRVPIVAFTAHALAEERAAALRAGFDAVISKPCLPDQLLQEVDDLLRSPRRL